MKLLAIDGNSIINRAFYGIKLLSTKDGTYTNAVYGFINILNKLLEYEKPDAVAVAFDLKAPTFRHKKYDAYKAGRKPMPNELATQFPILKEWLTLAGYTIIEKEGFEADDILGTLSYNMGQSGNTCAIATGDRDALQLISDTTRVLLAATKAGQPQIIDYNTDTLKEKYGLSPKQMIELKALMGDSSDNIPGVAGIGEKTATDLILRFDNIDYIYENLDSLDIKDGVKLKLANGKESAYLSRYLGTICLDAPIDTDINSYKIKDKSDDLAPFMAKLEFFKLMERMNISYTEKKVSLTPSESAKFELCDFNESLITDGITFYAQNGEYAAVSGEKVFICDKKQAEAILKSEKSKKTYNLKKLGSEFPYINNVTFDALLAGYLSNPSSNDYTINRLAAEYPVSDFESFENELINNAVLLSLVCAELEKVLDSKAQLDLLKNIEIPLSLVLSDMEKTGFLIDSEGLFNEGEELSVKIDEITKEIYSMAGTEFNINSPKQLGEILFEKLLIPAKKKTKSGYSTNADVLESLRYDYPIVDRVLNYRRLSKLKSTYCDGLLAAVSTDKRIHTTFNQTEARTGRISSLEPNLQNIPVRTEEGKKLRKFFIAKENFVLVDADYSQIELRVLASLADDKVMIDAFNSGVDIHTVTASEVFDIPVDMVLPVMRSRAKAVNFGIVYGIGAFSLSKDIGVSRAEADRYIKNYLNTYKGVDSYMKNAIENAKKTGFVSTYFGRRRYLPELSSSNGMIRSFGERVARNAPIQGTAADIIKLAMINVWKRLKNELPQAKLILQVHDELIVEAPKESAELAKKILSEEMENAVNLKVKLSVDANCGQNWLEAKG